MPKQVTLKSGEIITAYYFDEFMKVTGEDIEAQTMILGDKLRKKAHHNESMYA